MDTTAKALIVRRQPAGSHPGPPSGPAPNAQDPIAPAVPPKPVLHRHPNALDEPMIAAAGPWPGPSLKTAGGLAVPIGVGGAVGLFILVQALIDRRDPKVSAAPQRGRDDTVGFE